MDVEIHALVYERVCDSQCVFLCMPLVVEYCIFISVCFCACL